MEEDEPGPMTVARDGPEFDVLSVDGEMRHELHSEFDARRPFNHAEAIAIQISQSAAIRETA